MGFAHSMFTTLAAAQNTLVSAKGLSKRPEMLPGSPNTPLPGFGGGPSWKSAQVGSVLFETLPVEIRKQILVEAFGGRVLHIVHWKNPKTGTLQWSGGECTDVHVKEVRFHSPCVRTARAWTIH